MRIATIALLPLAAIPLLCVACGGSIPPPNDEYSAAQADVGRAEAGGAPGVPDAKLHLQLAQEDLAKSKTLIDQDNKRAADLIAVARVEAQLAFSLAKQQMAEDQARHAQGDLAKVKGGQ
ncbi:MAG TPA: DUF4398 domain-containing protein [Polyangiaceae bacterium]